MVSDLAVSTYTALGRQPLVSFLEELADAGHEQVEILAAPPHIDLENVSSAVAELRPALRRTGLRVISVVPSGVDVNLASTHAGMRRWSRQQFTAAASLAAELGARHVIVHPGRRHPLRPPPRDQLVSWVVDGIEAVLAGAERDGLRVLIENVPTGLIDTADECADVVTSMNGRIGLCYDVANGFMVEDVPRALAALRVEPDLVHVSDTRRDRWLHDALGTGEVPWDAVIGALTDRSYDRTVVLETLHESRSVQGLVDDAAYWTDAAHRAPKP